VCERVEVEKVESRAGIGEKTRVESAVDFSSIGCAGWLGVVGFGEYTYAPLPKTSGIK
jgi:hypothetical protein